MDDRRGSRVRERLLVPAVVLGLVSLVLALGYAYLFAPGERVRDVPAPGAEADRLDALPVVAEGRWEHRTWLLRAGRGPSGRDVCVAFRWQDRGAAGDACHDPSGSPHRIVRFGARPPSQPGEPYQVDGVVTADVALVRIEYDDGTSATVTTRPIPGTDLRVFWHLHPAQPVSFVALGTDGGELQRRP